MPKGKGSPYFQPQLSLLRTRTNYGVAVAYRTYSPKADSTWQVDAFGVRYFGSTMPECKHSVAAFALYAFVALVRMVPEWGRSSACYSPLFFAATSLYLLWSERLELKKCVMLPSSFATK